MKYVNSFEGLCKAACCSVNSPCRTAHCGSGRWIRQAWMSIFHITGVASKSGFSNRHFENPQVAPQVPPDIVRRVATPCCIRKHNNKDKKCNASQTCLPS